MKNRPVGVDATLKREANNNSSTYYIVNVSVTATKYTPSEDRLQSLDWLMDWTGGLDWWTDLVIVDGLLMVCILWL